MNYKDSIYGRGMLARMLGTSQRDIAFITTNQRRKERRERSRERWFNRRQLLS